MVQSKQYIYRTNDYGISSKQIVKQYWVTLYGLPRGQIPNFARIVCRIQIFGVIFGKIYGHLTPYGDLITVIIYVHGYHYCLEINFK